MQTEKIELVPVSETLYIPLAARAAETVKNNPVITDNKSVEIITRLDIEDRITDGGQVSAHGIIARTKVIDDEVGKILERHPDAVIINLGAGLDTRISRLDNGLLKWYDLDLPDVISARRRFFTENERIRFISKSVLDPEWVKDANIPEDSEVILIAEGLLMYFPEDDVVRIFELLAKHFNKAHMFFDVIHSFFINKKISITFLWGIDNAGDIEMLSPKIKLVESWSTGNLLKKRQSLFFRIFNFLPSTRNRSQILHVQLSS